MAGSATSSHVATSATEVVIDATQLTGQSSFSGIGTYVRGLLHGLARHPGVAVTALATSDAAVAPEVVRRTITRTFRSGRPGLYEHEVRRTLETRWDGALLHNPNPHAPLLPPARWVQTLHDVIPLVVDDPVGAALRRRFERFGPRYARASKVIAISRHAADEGIRLLGIDPARIEVIHHGIGPEFTPGPGPCTERPYLLVVCEYSRRKGLREALAVLDDLAEAGYPHRLVVAGRVPPWAAADFADAMAGCRHPDRVEVLGFVDDLPALYRGATAQVVSSRYEGFGFPAVEAMACGTPVVAFANTSLPEVVGEGGILVPDGDVAAFTGAVRSLLDSAQARAEARERALSRAATFTWERSAAAHAAVYASVAR